MESEETEYGCVCPTCGKELKTPNGMKKHHNYVHGESLAKDNVTLECDYCGDEYECLASRADESSFCSHSCTTKYYSGIRHPSSGADTNPRAAAIDRDNYTCQSCGCGVSRHKGDQAPVAEAHHLIPKAAGGPDAVENLITLCPECHKKAHSKLKNIDEKRPGILSDLQEYICGHSRTLSVERKDSATTVGLEAFSPDD